MCKTRAHSGTGSPSDSTSEETVVSDAASSTLKFETSPPRDELSSSPLMDGAGDASGVVVVVTLESVGDDDPPSVSSAAC